MPIPTDPIPLAQTKKMEMTSDIAKGCLHVMMTDNIFALKWLNTVFPNHWVDDIDRMIFRIVDGHYRKYREVPTVRILIQEIDNFIGIDDEPDHYLERLTEIINNQMTQAEIAYCKNFLLKYVEFFDWTTLTVEMATHISSGEYDQIPSKVRDIYSRHRSNEVSKEYLEVSVADRVAQEQALTNIFPSAFPTLNANHNGGYESGALTIFMGPSGSGKSIHLVNVGANLLKQNKNVMHITFELSAAKTQARYDVAITGHTHDERTKNPSIIDDSLRRLRKDTNFGKLYVAESPTGTCTVDEVRTIINEHQMHHDVKIDAVILDYLTIMKPNDAKTVDMTKNYDKMKIMAEEARALAMDLDIPVITAVQSNRGSLQKEVIGKGDIADSFAVIHVADLVLSINQTDDEKIHDRMRLHIAKSRNYLDGYTIVCHVNYNNLQVVENVEVTTAYNKQMHDRQTTEGAGTTKSHNHPVIYDPEAKENDLANVLPGIMGRPKSTRGLPAQPTIITRPGVGAPSAPTIISK